MTSGTLNTCRLCKSGNIKPILKKQDLHIYKCNDCKAVFLGNEINDRELKELYNYYAHDKSLNELSPITELRYDKILDVLEGYRKNNKLIDVGCGAGHFILRAAKRGWQADGSEISDDAINLAKDKGCTIIKGDIANIDLGKEIYDAATLFELMEHAVNPEGIVAKLSYALRPGGLIYITTPNYNSITRRILRGRWGVFHMEHQFYFTPGTLVSVLKKHNFRILRIKTENLSFGSKHYCRQESIRRLTEYNKFFSIMKRLVNFSLNLCKAGETIYLFAVKG